MSEYVFKTDSPIKICSECNYRCGLNIIARQNPAGRHEHCPLKELPPHGDLIDRQAVLKQLSKAWNVDDDSDFANKSVWRIIEKEAPIILEATE